MTEHKPLPVAGYTEQSSVRIAEVNLNKEMEERILRRLEHLLLNPEYDGRWIRIAYTHVQEAFMAANRAIFQPERAKLPEDHIS